MTNSRTSIMEPSSSETTLKRIISLPMLVFYGVGVTIGAGIFALSGEVLAISGNLAPWSFFLAALIAGVTAVSYSLLSSASPKAAGEAWFIQQAYGDKAGVCVGLLLVASALFSSAAITVSFVNYLQDIITLSTPVLMTIAVTTITLVACKGTKETVVFAAVITTIEVGALLVVIVVGFPQVLITDTIETVFIPQPEQMDFTLVASGAIVAFFAFIGFEDIVNMGEETVDAKRNLPIAIILTLFITLIIYMLVSLVCVAVADREAFVQSRAPLAHVFEVSTGKNPWIISFCAAIAMTNGILVQIVMSSRVLYGLSKSGSLPSWIGKLNKQTRTPVTAIVLVSALILLLSFSLTLVNLAVYSSMALLVVFSAVNLSLWKRGRSTKESKFRRWSYWGLMSFFACSFLLFWQIRLSLIASF